MRIDINKINFFFSTLNFILCFIGYQLITSLLLPNSSDLEGISRLVTVPYRGVALFVSLVAIGINLKTKIGKLPFTLKLLLLFWVLLICRILYDVFFGNNLRITASSQLWLYIFGICLPALISIIISFKYIHWRQALYWIYVLTVLTLVATLFSNQSLLKTDIEGRQIGNLALNTISFGHLGGTGVILSLFLIFKTQISTIKKIAIVCFMLLGGLIIIRAGSRGPLLAVLVVLLFWLFSKGRNFIIGIIAVSLSGLVLSIFFTEILELIGNISPVMETRINASIDEGDSSGREFLYVEAINMFFNNPIIGKQFALLHNGELLYSHNIILDTLISLGIIGGAIIIYLLFMAIKKSYLLIKRDNPHFWICLLLIQQIVFHMTSGAIYYNQLFSVLLAWVFIYYSQTYSFMTFKSASLRNEN